MYTEYAFDAAPLNTGDGQDVSLAVATLDGKAYYNMTLLLKRIGIPYRNLTPGEKVPKNIRLVLTTTKERPLIPEAKTVCLEELGADYGVAKERVYGHLYGSEEDLLVLGLDPGKRIGLAAYYQQREVASETWNSVDEVVARASQFLENSPAKRRIVRIGYGKPELAEAIARKLRSRVRGNLEIELVDERGTSSLAPRKPNSRGARDQRAARIIAFRPGRRV